MRVTRFDPNVDLIFVNGKIGSRHGDIWRPLRLVLDTGAAETIVVPEVLDELGYSPRDGEQITTMRSAVGHEQGYLTRVARFSCLGHRQDDFRNQTPAAMTNPTAAHARIGHRCGFKNTPRA